MKAPLEFEVINKTAGSLDLSAAILLYRGAGADGATFATVHEVSTKGKVPVILAGKAMTTQAAVKLALDLSKNAQRGGFVPPELLFMDGDVMCWWVPPAKRHIAFRCEELGKAERGEVVPNPGLVFRVDRGRRWNVWAVKGAERPGEDSLLYQAPYFNVSSSGSICVGNVQLPDGTTAERIGAWNSAFFGSFFTHSNVKKLVTYRGGAHRFWQDMLDGRHAGFPERVLLPLGKSLREALSEKGRHD